MNRNLFCCLFLSLVSFSVFSQTQEEKEWIAGQSNLRALDTLRVYFNNKYIQDQAKVKEYVLAHPGSEFIKLEKGGFAQLMRFTKNGYPLYYAIDNVNAAKSTRTNYMYGALDLNMEGQGMTVGVWDGGPARATHQEFTTSSSVPDTRLFIGDGSILNDNSDHGTHVSGTITARGAMSGAKGMGPKGSVISRNWDNDESEMTSAAASTASDGGFLVSNHSYGTPMYNGNTFAVENWFPGCYSSDARAHDIISFNAPYYLIVSSAGNEGNLTNPAAFALGFDKLTGDKNAKNNLVVANAQDASISSSGNLLSVSINSSSSVGPTDDLRIKPDITGNGTDLYSCIASGDTAYATYSGTSMASPNVAGSIILLQQYYNSLFGNYMRAATLKGLACHTADDAGVTGPDPIFGWGLLNMKFASETITAKENNAALIDELNFANASPSYEYSFNVSTTGKVIASISWTDPAGTSQDGQLNDTDPVLVNDLDIRIIKDGTTTYLPWKLDPENISTATTGDNEADNVERVEIPNAEPGNYVVKITKKGTLLNFNQKYSLILTGPNLMLGTDQHIAADDLAVFPNPASTELYYSTGNLVQLTDVSIFDLTGKKIVCNVNSSQKIIDVSNLSAGMYFAKFAYEGGVITKKFIKK